MKKMERKYKIIIIVSVITLCISIILMYSLSKNRKITFIEKGVKDSILWIEDIIFSPIHFIDEKMDELKELNQLSKKYKDLKDEIDQYDLLKHQYNELKKENEELKKLLDLNSLNTDYISINANVINRNLGYWFDLITINKGSKDGIEVGDAVISVDGMIGEVRKVSFYHSTIQLLTNNEDSNKISVKLNMENKELYGLLTGYNKDKNIFMIEGISDNEEIKIGTEVVTAGLANNYPSGILIGKVINIVSDNFDLSRTLEVTPSSNFNNLSYVSVLRRNLK